MRWFYFAFPIVVILWAFIRGRQFQREKGHLVVPPHDLFGRWEGQGWVAELGKDSVSVCRPDGSMVPIDAVVRQTYKRGYLIQQTRGIALEKLAFVPVEMNEKHFTKLILILQKDLKTLAKVELCRV